MNEPLPANDGRQLSIETLAGEEGHISASEPYFGFRWSLKHRQEVEVFNGRGLIRPTMDHLRIGLALLMRLQKEAHFDGSWVVVWGKPRTLLECPMLSAEPQKGFGPIAGRLEPRGRDLSQVMTPKLLQASWRDADDDIHFRLSSTDSLEEIYAADDLFWVGLADQAYRDYHERLRSLELRPGVDTHMAAKMQNGGLT